MVSLTHTAPSGSTLTSSKPRAFTAFTGLVIRDDARATAPDTRAANGAVSVTGRTDPPSAASVVAAAALSHFDERHGKPKYHDLGKFSHPFLRGSQVALHT